MSLFSSRQWWHTRLGSGEEFDQGSICVANIDNDPVGTVKVITGSLQGVLRVHQPHQQGYHIEDILLEAQLDSSILQLAAGNFLGGTSLCLAVLHPCKLSVYTLQAVGSSYLQLSKLYEHALEHTAANLTYGPFGGVTGVDHIVVQSYDGQLNFFEQEVQSFSRLLPDFLLPGPLAYMAASDSFITTTAGLELVAYRYSNIAAASWEPKQQPGAGGSGKRIQEDWKVVLGESALDIKAGNVSTAADGTDAQTAPSILVLAEHTFFILGLSGHILVQRRLDNHPSCFWPYPAAASTDAAGTRGSNSSSTRGSASTSSGWKAPSVVQAENLLIATHTKALQVYRGQQLAWAAQLELLPVAVRVTSVGGVKGMIVALDDEGNLSVLYLGTEPPKQTIASSEARPMDYAAMEQERLALLSKLKAAGGAAGLDAAAAAKAEAKASSSQAPLLLKAKVPSRLDNADSSSISGGFGVGLGGGIGQQGQQQQQLTVTLVLTNNTAAALRDVSISVLAPAPVEAAEAKLSIPQLAATRRGAAATSMQLVFHNPGSTTDKPAYLPSSNTAQVVVTYKAAGGQPGVAQLSIQLPMCLFCQVIPPVKIADFKLTLSTNREAVQMMELFGDMVAQANPAHAEAISRSQAANMLSFTYPGGQDVSILVSKNGGRYRLQASCLEAMWLVLQELQARLSAHFIAADKKPHRPQPPATADDTGSLQQQSDGSEPAAPGPLHMTFNDALPLQDLFELVDQHFATRTAISSIDAQLEQQGVTFRSIQKRLLVRYKDKNAAPLNQLDVLMEEVYEQIMDLADKLAAAQEQLLATGQALGAGVQTLLLLCKLQFGLPAEDMQVLSSCLSPVVHSGLEVGWEEETEAAMTQLLKSCLARSQKDAAAVVPPLAPAQDTARLTKHITLVLERLAKGMRLSSNASSGAAA